MSQLDNKLKNLLPIKSDYKKYRRAIRIKAYNKTNIEFTKALDMAEKINLSEEIVSCIRDINNPEKQEKIEKNKEKLLELEGRLKGLLPEENEYKKYKKAIQIKVNKPRIRFKTALDMVEKINLSEEIASCIRDINNPEKQEEVEKNKKKLLELEDRLFDSLPEISDYEEYRKAIQIKADRPDVDFLTALNTVEKIDPNNIKWAFTDHFKEGYGFGSYEYLKYGISNKLSSLERKFISGNKIYEELSGYILNERSQQYIDIAKEIQEKYKTWYNSEEGINSTEVQQTKKMIEIYEDTIKNEELDKNHKKLLDNIIIKNENKRFFSCRNEYRNCCDNIAEGKYSIERTEQIYKQNKKEKEKEIKELNKEYNKTKRNKNDKEKIENLSKIKNNVKGKIKLIADERDNLAKELMFKEGKIKENENRINNIKEQIKNLNENKNIDKKEKKEKIKELKEKLKNYNDKKKDYKKIINKIKKMIKKRNKEIKNVRKEKEKLEKQIELLKKLKETNNFFDSRKESRQSFNIPQDF